MKKLEHADYVEDDSSTAIDGQEKSSTFLSNMTSKYKALALAGALFVQGCTTTTAVNTAPSSIEIRNPYRDAIKNLVNNLGRTGQVPSNLLTRMSQIANSLSNPTSEQHQVFEKVKNLGIKIQAILQRGSSDQINYANSVLKMLLMAFQLDNMHGNLNDPSNLLWLGVKDDHRINQDYNALQGRPVNRYQPAPSPRPIQPPKPVRTPQPPKTQPKPRPEPRTVVITPPTKVTITRVPITKPRKAPQSNDTQDRPEAIPTLDQLWDKMPKHWYSRKLKRKIIGAYKLDHRWKQLQHLLQNSRLKEVLYYLQMAHGRRSTRRSSKRLSRFLFENQYRGKKYADILERLKALIEYAKDNQLTGEKKEQPSFNNIRPGLQKLEAKIDQGVTHDPNTMVVVDVSQQLMYVVKRNGKNSYDENNFRTLPVSTARFGTYEKTGRVKGNRTPIGPMRVEGKWGKSKRYNQVYDGGWTRKRASIERTRSRRSAVMMGRLFPLASLDRRTPASGIFIHTTNKELYLGTPGSHGCVRVSNKSAQLLFKLLKKKTLVYIQH